MCPYVLPLLILMFYPSDAARRQCFTCRSRGNLGDCRDPFPYNGTTALEQTGINVTPCPSGWCAKTIEGIRGPPDDFGTATERTCMNQAPPDGEERCAELVIHNKPSLLCVCRGDLCNSSSALQLPSLFFLIAAAFLFLPPI